MSEPEDITKKDGAAAPEHHVNPDRRRVSFAPFAVPPPEPQMKPNKRRWSLIRSLAKGKRLTSLTKEEDHVLKTLSSHDTSSFRNSRRSTDTASSAESQKADEVRDKLRKSIAVHSRELTEIETEFLYDVIDTPDIASEQIEAVEMVLHCDPLYQQRGEEKAEEIKKDEKNDKDIKRLSTISQGASYRKELWTHLRAESQEISEETLTFTSVLNTKDNKEELPEQAPPKEQPKRKSSQWGFLYNFQKALNLIDNRNEEEETVDLEQEENPTFGVLAHSIDDFLDTPAVLTPPIMDALRTYLPFAVKHDNFWLKYSLNNGASMAMLLHKIRNSARTIIAIETDQGEVFGSFTSSPWRVQPSGFYGSAEAFVWRLKKSRFTRCASIEEQIELESDIEVFEWSRKNRNIQSCKGFNDEMTVGGGGYEDDPDNPDKDFGSALTLSDDLSRGFSERCLTFDSPPLCVRNKGGVFNIMNIEVWTLTPVFSLEGAEKLELSRHFIFDHGNFALA
jgi:hypothetical protein